MNKTGQLLYDAVLRNPQTVPPLVRSLFVHPKANSTPSQEPSILNSLSVNSDWCSGPYRFESSLHQGTTWSMCSASIPNGRLIVVSNTQDFAHALSSQIESSRVNLSPPDTPHVESLQKAVPRLVRGLSHDVMNSVSSQYTFLDTLLDVLPTDNLTSRQELALRSVREKLAHTTSLIANYVAALDIGLGNLQSTIRKCDAKQVIEETIALCHQPAKGLPPVMVEGESISLSLPGGRSILAGLIRVLLAISTRISSSASRVVFELVPHRQQLRCEITAVNLETRDVDFLRHPMKLPDPPERAEQLDHFLLSCFITHLGFSLTKDFRGSFYSFLVELKDWRD